jgi:chromosome segregation ATPase
MAGEQSLADIIDRMSQAMKAIEGTVESRDETSRDYREAEEEVQRMNADRMRLAQELDGSEARAERLEKANKEVSRRLVAAMETIRAVLDR